MGEAANVESIDALKYFRVAVIKFTEAASTALNDSESDLHDMLRWLENEQLAHWQGQIRKGHDALERAKEALRMKRLYRDSAGRIPAAIEEEKALRLAQFRMEEAERKVQAVKKFTRILQKEIDSYRGATQPLATFLTSQMPVAAARLNEYIKTLEAYIMVAPPDDSAPPAPPAEEHQGS
jgi:glycosyltransferase A (GT-A) superfamily protein (DUF2064 family)